MVEFIFNFLQQVGFNHPLHPASTHIPMGMVMGAFFFGLAALKWPDKPFASTAFHCSVLGLLFLIPTAIAGILDWQYSFQGELGAIIVSKMVLAVILLATLIVAVKMGLQKSSAKNMLIIYSICLLIVSALGFLGGQLLYG
jgi:uncharacterized membrane protein